MIDERREIEEHYVRRQRELDNAFRWNLISIFLAMFATPFVGIPIAYALNAWLGVSGMAAGLILGGVTFSVCYALLLWAGLRRLERGQ